MLLDRIDEFLVVHFQNCLRSGAAGDDGEIGDELTKSEIGIVLDQR